METVVALTLLIVLAAAIYAADRVVARGWNARPARRSGPAAGFPGVLSRDAHWQRVTGMVERSITRASDISAHQASAARQLEAADYALHCLLDELGDVMMTTVRSPLQMKAMVPTRSAQAPAAMAA
jgi:hypothetical protein